MKSKPDLNDFDFGRLVKEEIAESLSKGERPDTLKVLTWAVADLRDLTKANNHMLTQLLVGLQSIYDRIDFRKLTRQEYAKEMLRQRTLDRLVRAHKQAEGNGRSEA